MFFDKPEALVEEKLNTYSHGIGVVFSIIGLLFFLELTDENPLKAPVFIYSFSLIFLFTASTIYHGVSNSKMKRKLRVIDHISIYYLIAATYTPVCYTILADSKGILLLWLVWGIAIFGTVLKLFFTGKFEAFSLVLYGVMGWLIVIDLPFLIENVSSTLLFYLGIGGAFYTIGIFFYATKKIPFNHFIWHLFVLAGALAHWLMIKEVIS